MWLVRHGDGLLVYKRFTKPTVLTRLNVQVAQLWQRDRAGTIRFYSAAALLAMQSAVLSTAIPSFRLSVTRWYPIQMNEDRIVRS